jgi:uncharacterized protein YndB with AHSA1/START domain
MWEYETSIDIAVPPDDVYRYLADFGRHAEWSMSVAVLEQVTPGPVGVGTEFKATETLPQDLVSFARITALDEPTLIGWESTDYQVFRTRWTIALSQRNGGTHLVQRVHFEPIGDLGEQILLMRKEQVPEENQRSLGRMKAILEGKSKPGTH